VRYFEVTYEWHTRPRFKRGRLKQCKVTFAASDQTEAYRLAQEDGTKRFPRHRWQVVSCEELTVHHNQKEKIMTTPASPLSAITTDTATLEASLKSSFGTLSADAKAGLTQALSDAHKEVTDLTGAASSIWASLLAAVGKAPTPAPAPPAATTK
jgi:hypothetical protein